MTRLATVWPATTFTLDVSGAGVPCGQTVRKLVVLGCVTVTFRATDTAPAGTLAPASVTLRISPGPNAGPPCPAPARVSSTRTGVMAWKPSLAA